MDHPDIIIALATPQGMGAIGVIRLSGNGCIDLVDSVFSKSLINKSSHTIHYGQLEWHNKILDDCLVSLFRTPKSYTKEDVVEISCHGSIYIIESIIKLFVSKGARLANKGEFTMRAFLNGQLDLSQAEAVADLISAENEAAQQLAIKQLRGGFSQNIADLRAELISFASLIELELDFGEEDVEFANREDLKKTVQHLSLIISTLMKSFDLGNSIKHGIPTVIIGKPNAGKSTLLNALVNEERVIVSPIAGTTRDAVDDTLIIDGMKFILTDTAGLRDTEDEIERIGVETAKLKIKKATILIYVVDVTQTPPDVAWKELDTIATPDAQLLLLLNKMDLYTTLDPKSYIKEGLIESSNIIPISALNKMNTEYLKKKLIECAKVDMTEGTIVTNVRHLESLTHSLEALSAVMKGLESNISGDFISMDLKQALYYLGLITGEIHTDDLLDSIFSNFCIGK